MKRDIPVKFVELLDSLGLADLADTLREGEPAVSVRLNNGKA